METTTSTQISDGIQITKEYTIQQLNNIKQYIENMNLFDQLEVLKILNNSDVILNENKNGNYVNLTEIKIEILDKLVNYINYVKEKEKLLEIGENQKKEYKKNLNKIK